MNTNSCVACGIDKVRINGRTLKASINRSGANAPDLGYYNNTHWVELCPQCHASILTAADVSPTPFLCADGMMRSIGDFDAGTSTFRSVHQEFCGFRFTQAALDGAIALISDLESNNDGASTFDVEKLGASVLANSNKDSALQFCEKVCIWGGGARVWGNLVKRKSEVAQELVDWFKQVARATTDEEAIVDGIAIDGLAASFASKHLRMLAPDRFAVLDSVLSEGFGFALNPKGYALFMRCLRSFKTQIGFAGNVAQLEYGLFMLVRQVVRSNPQRKGHESRD